MSPDETQIKILKDLGFTINQAKVYLALVDREFSAVKEIQKTSQVPRQEIYKILSTLQEMGFLQTTVTRPVMFKTIPIKQAVSFLLKRKIQETEKLQKEAEIMVENYHPNHSNNIEESKPHFILISKQEANIMKRREEIDNAQLSLDFVTSWKRFPLTINTIRENAKKALERKVGIRVIVEKPKDMNELSENIYDLKKFSNYKLRYIISAPKAIVAIFDKKKALIKISATDGLAETPALWTDNPCLLSILSDYFELMWITAMEHLPEQISQENPDLFEELF